MPYTAKQLIEHKIRKLKETVSPQLAEIERLEGALEVISETKDWPQTDKPRIQTVKRKAGTHYPKKLSELLKDFLGTGAAAVPFCVSDFQLYMKKTYGITLKRSSGSAEMSRMMLKEGNIKRVRMGWYAKI